ncbi:amidohydrolase family protein [Actinomadura opuntiae]|uniref:amidohydrolase family protein n=1 Tax=Actinomadura sp. OS1-43 TaxID=604315 RepID=UPI00255A9F99|nr:amidohydrolase family protein [Actinomadura sp. OS1-43]MDL4819514.1 amidohydrolase family protein [Actinomadura sp. OS1-43]
MTEPRSDAAVPAFWQALGLPGIVDAHVHFMPQRLMSAVWAYFDDAGPLIGTEWPIRYRDSEKERLEFLRGLGVRAFTALVYPHRPGMAESLNEWGAEFARRVPECLQTATFFPEPGVAGYVRRALDSGARVFKVHLQVGGFDPRAGELDEVWGILADAGVPALVHAGSGPVANGFTGPEPFGGVLARHPRLKTIIAHLGAPEFDGFFALADRHEGVHLDTTMTFTRFGGLGAFPAELLPRLRDLGLQGRILLGTDFPNIPYEYAHQLEALAGLGFGDDWLRAVCWEAADTLFDLAASTPGLS